jgi:hypothetical protein
VLVWAFGLHMVGSRVKIEEGFKALGCKGVRVRVRVRIIGLGLRLEL